MMLRNYLMLCAAGAAITALAILLVPGVADAFEGILLAFLSSNAS